jgi:putative oxidoreductase
MKWLYLVCRILLGGLFIFAGISKFHPPHQAMAMSAPAQEWFGVMMSSGWMRAVGAFEILGGLLVLAGVTVPLGIVVLCPITVNILLFCITLSGGHGIGTGLGTAALELALIYGYRTHFASIWDFKSKPSL